MMTKIQKENFTMIFDSSVYRYGVMRSDERLIAIFDSESYCSAVVERLNDKDNFNDGLYKYRLVYIT